MNSYELDAPPPGERGVNPSIVKQNRRYLEAVKVLLALNRADCTELAKVLLEEVEP